MGKEGAVACAVVKSLKETENLSCQARKGKAGADRCRGKKGTQADEYPGYIKRALPSLAHWPGMPICNWAIMFSFVTFLVMVLQRAN